MGETRVAHAPGERNIKANAKRTFSLSLSPRATFDPPRINNRRFPLSLKKRSYYATVSLYARSLAFLDLEQTIQPTNRSRAFPFFQNTITSELRIQTTIRVHPGRLIVAINTRETFIGLSIERVKHVCTRSREFSRYRYALLDIRLIV